MAEKNSYAINKTVFLNQPLWQLNGSTSRKYFIMLSYVFPVQQRVYEY